AVRIQVLEQLRLLSNLETSTEKLLRLVLVGQPQLAALLVDPALAQLNQRITLRWHLGPLTAEETAAYVRHRLSVASGGKVTELFTRPALRLVHRLSRGVPRLVNIVAHRGPPAAYVPRRRPSTPRRPHRRRRVRRRPPRPPSSSSGSPASRRGRARGSPSARSSPHGACRDWAPTRRTCRASSSPSPGGAASRSFPSRGT